ncbi:MAG: hypothetical protein WC528_02380 [Patescibacteria group bacterium]
MEETRAYYEIKVTAGLVVITVYRGKYDRETIGLAVAKLLADRRLSLANLKAYKAIVLDVSMVDMNSAGIGGIIALTKKYSLACPGKKIYIIIGRNERVRNLIRVTRLDIIVTEVPAGYNAGNIDDFIKQKEAEISQ